MFILELFKGSGSIGKAAQRHGINIISLDINKDYNPDICIDFMEFDYKSFLEKHKSNLMGVWASPPCETFSLAAGGKHRETGSMKPISKEAKKADLLIDRLMSFYKLLYDNNITWFIENPRGRLRSRLIDLDSLLTTVYYCQYGFDYKKPTHIWSSTKHTNHLSGIKCEHKKHIGGIQKIKKITDRYKMPEKLCDEIIQVFIKKSKYDKVIKNGSFEKIDSKTIEFS